MDLLAYTPQKTFSQIHLLTLADCTCDEVMQMLSAAVKFKSLQKKGIAHEVLKGKSVGMYFTKPSARTRVSFEVGIHQLGA
nr:ornithine carbamoyltransferase [bacterium]